MKKSIVFLFMSSVLLFSCSSDDDAQKGGNVQPTAYDLTIYGTWKIISYGTHEERNDVKQVGDKLADNEEFFTMVLHADGRMSGYTSKNYMQARFVTGVKDFRFVSFGMTRMDENDNADNAAVYNYVANRIPKVKSYQLNEDGNLQLYYSDTEYLLLVKVTKPAVEKKNPFIGKWELVMDILNRDTTFYEPGKGYLEFTESGECNWVTKLHSIPDFANASYISYTFDDEYIYYIYYILGRTPGYLADDHYELNGDSTQLKMWNFQFNVSYLVDPKIPISVYRKQK